ncbi:MAG: hypothetical protein P8Y80_06935 [Acidobacteriota bacterium]
MKTCEHRGRLFFLMFLNRSAERKMLSGTANDYRAQVGIIALSIKLL